MNKLHIGLLSTLLLSFSAFANDVPYSYAEGSFSTYDDADGLSAGISYEFQNNFYAIGDYSRTELEVINIDLVDLKIGAGYHYSIAPATDVFSELAFLNRNFDGGSGASIDDNGYLIALGLRKMLKPNIELRARFEYEDIFEGSETNFDFGGMYYFDNQFALGASLQTRGNNDLEGFVLRGRFVF